MPPKFQQRNIVETTSADNGQQTETTTTTAATITENASGDAQAQQQQQSSADEKRFTQAELDAKIAERLERDRQARKQKAEQEQSEAERKRLAEEGKLKELSEKQATDLLTLTTEKETLTTQVTTLEEKVKQYEDLFNRQLTEQKKALPEPVQALLAKMPLLDQMAWMTENATKLGVTVKALPVTPKGDNGGTSTPVDEYISTLNKGQEKK